ncbi:MAG TPA: hypothetical protein VHP58_03790 [Alphaproteobacteria bacterium]|nr:hypothetical protein [Alphaproteobacteria bacterium]
MWDEAAIANWYEGPLGQRLVRHLLKHLKKWPVLRWQGREAPAVLALGHAEVLEHLWPGEWEIPGHRSSNRYDRVVLMHDPMFDEAPEETLNACWREVVPGGLVLLVLTNKWGLPRWNNNSPLSHGRAYRAGRLGKLVRESGFTLLQHQTLIPGWSSGAPTWLPFPNLLRVAVLRKDEPAVTRLRLKPLRAPGVTVAPT